MFVVCYNNLDFAIPFRSNINHNHYYKTSDSIKAGIDYSKSVIILDNKYIDSINKPVIRKDEAKKVIGKGGIIKKGFIEYIDKYIISIDNLVNGNGSPKDYYLCKYSTLQNFHTQLQIKHIYTEVMDQNKLVFKKKP